MKKARVIIIKDNITQGTSIPSFTNDCEVGQWVDNLMTKKGHVIDSTGLVDMPEYGIDNKSRKKGSKAHHTVGSMTIPAIIDTEKWEDTRFFAKTQNQNQITWDPVFQEVSNVKLVDMALPEIQIPLSKAYENLREKLIKGDRSKTIKSDCGWAVLDGYGHENSYRFRITNFAMKQILTISATRDSFSRNFDIK
jgi:hypothetical protein